MASSMQVSNEDLWKFVLEKPPAAAIVALRSFPGHFADEFDEETRLKFERVRLAALQCPDDLLAVVPYLCCFTRLLIQQERVVRAALAHSGDIAATVNSMKNMYVLQGNKDGGIELLRGQDAAKNVANIVTDPKIVQIWDLSKKDLIGTVSTMEHRGFALHPDGTHIAVSDSDTDQLTLWDFRQQKLSQTFPTKVGFVQNVVFSRDGRYLAFDHNSLLQIQNLEEQTNSEIESQSAIQGITFSPDGLTLAVSKESRRGSTLQLWDMPSGLSRLEISLPDRRQRFKDVAFANDGRNIVTNIYPSGLAYWLSSSGALLSMCTARGNGSSMDLTASSTSPGGTAVLTGDTTGEVQVWSGSHVQPLANIPVEGSPILNLAIQPDHTIISVTEKGIWSSHSKLARLWDMHPSEVPKELLEQLIKSISYQKLSYAEACVIRFLYIFFQTALSKEVNLDLLCHLEKVQAEPISTVTELHDPQVVKPIEIELIVDLTRYHPALFKGSRGFMIRFPLPNERFVDVEFPQAGLREILYKSLKVIDQEYLEQCKDRTGSRVAEKGYFAVPGDVARPKTCTHIRVELTRDCNKHPGLVKHAVGELVHWPRLSDTMLTIYFAGIGTVDLPYYSARVMNVEEYLASQKAELRPIKVDGRFCAPLRNQENSS